MLKRLGPRTRWPRGLAGLVSLLLLVAALWAFLPARPVVRCTTPVPCAAIIIADDEHAILTVHPETYILWDADSGQQRHRFDFQDPDTRSPVLWDRAPMMLTDDSGRIAPDGRTVVFFQQGARSGGGYTLWHPAAEPATVHLPDSEVPLAFTAGSQLLLTIPSLRYWDTTTGQLRHALEPAGQPPVIRVLTDGHRHVVAVRQDESLTVWDLNERRQVLHVPGYELSRTNFTGRIALLSGDGRRMVTAGAGRLAVWDLSDGTCLGDIVIPAPAIVTPLHLSPDGRRLIALERNKTDTGTLDMEKLLKNRAKRWVVWDVAGPPRELGSLPEGLPSPCFSPDSRWIHSVSRENWRWYDATTLQPGTGVDPAEFMFAPDCQTIARQVTVKPGLVASLIRPGDARDTGVTIWERTTGREVAFLPAPACKLFQYFPSSRKIVVWQDDGTMQVWDIPPRRPWWIEFGLPVVFAVLVLLAVRFVWRTFRTPRPTEAAPC